MSNRIRRINPARRQPMAAEGERNMTAYMIRTAKKADGSENDDRKTNKRVESVSPRAARRQFRKSYALHPTTELICE